MLTFWAFLVENQEHDIISILPQLSPIQQVKLDIELHNKAISRGTFGGQTPVLQDDNIWKQKLLDIFAGKIKNPQMISQIIVKLKKDRTTHTNRDGAAETGSEAWHQAWLDVYSKWIDQLNKMLGAVHGQTNR